MGKGEGVPYWAARHFGDQAEEVSRRVVAAMVKAQKASFEVQAFASGEGATNRRPYGSMWESRYTFLEDEMKGLDGYETFRPPGASFRLVRLNGCLLLPIRHASSLSKPLSQVHIPDASHSR
ncbi:hypothetical protein AB0I53_16465 [Saccharopolyspora sp. NPDC050389]|uniref:hypothetical protein n=1 Tax=Saccharopolyspora sp. NPDC050389 TaxID=3155516 RepID=UPI0033EFEA85